MPRSRRHLNPKALAREAGRRGSRMRSWSGGRPDQATVLVEERLADGRYKVRRDHWPCSIYVPVTPPGALIPTPRRMRQMFEEGSPQKPFLLWYASRRTVGTELIDSAPDWPTFRANFQRTNGRLDVEFTPMDPPVALEIYPVHTRALGTISGVFTGASVETWGGISAPWQYDSAEQSDYWWDLSLTSDGPIHLAIPGWTGSVLGGSEIPPSTTADIEDCELRLADEWAYVPPPRSVTWRGVLGDDGGGGIGVD